MHRPTISWLAAWASRNFIITTLSWRFELLGGAEVVIGNNEANAVVKIFQIVGFQGFGALQFEIGQRKANLGGFAQQRYLSGDCAFELAPVR
jgi:hypothetical protein